MFKCLHYLNLNENQVSNLPQIKSIELTLKVTHKLVVLISEVAHYHSRQLHLCETQESLNNFHSYIHYDNFSATMTQALRR